MTHNACRNTRAGVKRTAYARVCATEQEDAHASGKLGRTVASRDTERGALIPVLLAGDELERRARLAGGGRPGDPGGYITSANREAFDRQALDGEAFDCEALDRQALDRQAEDREAEHRKAEHREAEHGEAEHGEAEHGEAPDHQAQHRQAQHRQALDGEAEHREAHHSQAPDGEAQHREAVDREAPHHASQVAFRLLVTWYFPPRSQAKGGNSTCHRKPGAPSGSASTNTSRRAPRSAAPRRSARSRSPLPP